MAGNLEVTHYNNGNAITNITNNSSWNSHTTGAYCDYNNSTSNAETYGRLYNWYAVDDSRGICPIDYHVPTNAEWTILTDFLGGTDVAGGKMKETGTFHWDNPNTGATNESGFTALPGGFRGYNNGGYMGLGYSGLFLSSTEYNSDGQIGSTYMELYADSTVTNQYSFLKYFGYSVRCLKD
jgi:uncharacterized protein (TIGR02145 family)